ncbi:MAG TPA: AMP-binding protein, partial [Leptospiraceae bacterium]|nr:AMP-binding protein [Leptospiraceae bacterium]
YAVCSSGSSGEPKVIHILHRGILNFLIQQIEVFQMNEKSRILMNTPLGFDASISEIGVSLLSGAAVCISSKDLKNPRILMKEADRMSVTHLYIPPSLLPFISTDMIPDSLETVFFGGEESSPEKVKQFASRLRMINIYGPAETTVCASMAVCGTEWKEQNIGRPIKNTEWILMNAEGRTDENRGEICISGTGLAKGYIGQSRLNESKFVFYNDKIYYRTGDLAEKTADGSYIFKGRKDRQWKRNGRLIEPAELEKTALSLFPGTRSAALPDSQKRPVLFLEMPDSDTALLRKKIKETLPPWFTPSRIICIQRFPVNINGKTDYSKLSEKLNHPEDNKERRQDICSLAWETGTGHLPDSEEEDFFDSGGDSVSILRTALFLSENGYDLSVSDFYEEPSFRKLKSLLNSESERLISREFLKKAAEEFLCIKTQYNDKRFNEEIRTVLVTGASGGLGSEICRILCTKYRTRTVGLYFRNEPVFSHPLFVPVQSDLRKSFLGLEKSVWTELSESADCIIHCGAEVHLLKSFSAVKDTNLGGLRNILIFQNSGRKKNLECISTLGFFLNSDLKTKNINEDLDFSGISKIIGGYSASKFCAELMLKKLILSGSENIRIFRPGLLFKNSDRNEKKDLFRNILKDAGHMKSFPSSEDFSVDLTPAEICAESICELIFIKTEEKIFHIANPNEFTLADMAVLVTSMHPAVTVKDLSEWNKDLSDEIFAGAGLSRLSGSRFYAKNSALDIFRRTGFTFSLNNILKYSENDSVRAFLSGKNKLTFS